MRYVATRESVDQHSVPAWFDDAKLGIFIHWGLYSVPAWAPLVGELSQVLASGDWATWFANNPYAEWYQNSLNIEESPTQRYHRETYGADFDYADFAPMFEAATQRWDPTAWAALFRQVGARYVVLTTKHHDGFLLWPSRHPNPRRPGYQMKRDLVGELTSAVRAQGMRMGLYYSGGLDWTFNPPAIRSLQDLMMNIVQSPEYVTYANSHWRELIECYRPSILWNDIGYPAAANLNELFADYYNQIPDGLVNDRFAQRPQITEHGFLSDNHYDFRTPEYTSFQELTPFKWEATRGIGASFGYNRNEGPEHYQSVASLVRSFVDIVSKNGNLLLNVGPTADGAIPDLQRERLEGLGKWLAVNGEAIFDTRPWSVAEGKAREGVGVRFTRKGDRVYAILLDRPAGSCVTVLGLRASGPTQVRLLGKEGTLGWRQAEDGLEIDWPAGAPEAPAYALEITPPPERRGG